MRVPPLSEIIGRPPAFPVGLCVQDRSLYEADFDGVRILLNHYDTDSGRMMPELLRHARPDDVVFVPLYAGHRISDRYVANGTHQRLECYEENMAYIREAAPSVRGILVGNCGPELSFKDTWMKQAVLNHPRGWMSDMMCAFAAETSAFIKAAGGTPFYGTVDWDIAIDFHYGRSSFRNTCNALGAVQICFCGYQLFGLDHDGPSEIVPHPDDEFYFECCPVMEQMPKLGLQEYLRGGEIWTGLFGLDGLRRCNDAKLKGYGFSAGVVGIDSSVSV
jgi:hypothetical protein